MKLSLYIFIYIIFFLKTDTDSVIFKQGPDDFELNTGNYLGCLTDEVPPGKKIIAFRSTAPKTYGLLFDDGSEELRMKGITLHFLNKGIFNFESFGEIIRGEREFIESAPKEEFRRVKHRGIVYKRKQVKTFKMTFYKRVLVKDKTYSVPFGYRGELF